MDRLTDVNRPDWMKMDATKKMLCERLWQYENTGLDPQQIKDMQFCLREKSRECAELRRELQELKNKKNDGWISVEERVPEDGTDVLVVLKPTYESDYIEYSIARYLRFENDEAHWCDNHYGYLEWDKYSDGRGGSSQHKVIAWQSIVPYRPERSEE